MTVFNIVHLTDLHFGAVPGRANFWLSNPFRRKFAALRQGTSNLPPTHNPQRAERVAAWLYEETSQLEAAGDQLDALILSGDQATTGLIEDLEAALDYVDAAPIFHYFRAAYAGEPPGSPHLATIAELAKHCILIPGNHDRFENNHCEPGGKLFDTVFDKYWASNKHGVVSKIISKPASGASPVSADGLERLAIIGIDGSLRSTAEASSKLTQKSQGYLHDDTEKELRAQTDAARQQFPDIAVLWVVHFPPHPGTWLHEAMRNHHLIEQASRQLGVALILSGHTHVNRVYPASTGSAIWNGGSATQYAEGKGNWVQFLKIEVKNNRFVKASRQNFNWRVENWVHDFFPASTNDIP